MNAQAQQHNIEQLKPPRINEETELQRYTRKIIVLSPKFNENLSGAVTFKAKVVDVNTGQPVTEKTYVIFVAYKGRRRPIGFSDKVFRATTPAMPAADCLNSSDICGTAATTEDLEPGEWTFYASVPLAHASADVYFRVIGQTKEPTATLLSAIAAKKTAFQRR